jgi:protoheme IX farnesyltransferase
MESSIDSYGKSHWKDYLLLTKPIVVALLLVTTLAAMIVGGGRIPEADLIFWTLLGGGFTAGGASAINQYIDRDRDKAMSRTSKRPLPDGRLSATQVIRFGIILSLLGVGILALRVNLLSAGLAAFGFFYYVVLYSLILKPTTPQNIVIGGGAGAIPPMVGWAAATGGLSIPAFFLFALIFFWTPPHFWALALLKERDYARAGVPMLPVVIGERETRVHILLYSLQLVAFSMLLPLADLGGGLYFILAVVLGSLLIHFAIQLWKNGGNRQAWSMYRYSSTYLALIFFALVADTLIV